MEKLENETSSPILSGKFHGDGGPFQPRTSMRHIETMRGRGIVRSKDGEGFAVRYELNIFQEDGNTGPGIPPISGLREIQGFVRPVQFFGEDRLLLQMHDGRKLRFSFINLHGSIALCEWIG